MTSKTETLRHALRGLLARHQADGMLPTSARFLFYVLVSAGVIPKHATGARRPDQDMNDALTDLRQSGEVPWAWIADETRSLGDFDLAGGDIEANTKRVLERYHDLAWERLALTANQVRDHNLTPIIKADRRFKNGGAHEAVETEALSQRLIVEIVRDRLEALMPAPLANIQAREETERQALRDLIERGQ